MISYFDTSVLFAALEVVHERHIASRIALEGAQARGKIVCLSNHVFAELYANITRYPTSIKTSPVEALATIQQLSNSVITIDLAKADYLIALQRCADLGLISGVIYDALHLQAAIKAEADVLYTANLRDFKRLWTDELTMELVGVG